MKEPHIEGPATHDDPESCAVAREGGGEALTGARTGAVLSREIRHSGAPTPLSEAEGHIEQERQREPLPSPAPTLDPTAAQAGLIDAAHAHETRTSNWLCKIVGIVFTRTHSKCAHHRRSRPRSVRNRYNFEFVECAAWVVRRSDRCSPFVRAVPQYSQGTMRFVVCAYRA
jgi:hypothetical protein